MTTKYPEDRHGTESKLDSNLCFKVEDENPVIFLLYVDDLFVTGIDELIANTKRKLAAEFEMKDLGIMHYFLGMEVWQSRDGIFLGQGKYAVEILKRLRMMDLLRLQPFPQICKILDPPFHFI